MSNLPDNFDQVAIVIDWLDACRRRDLVALLDLYAQDASLLCECERRKSYRGRSELEAYWRSRFDGNAPNAFELEEIAPASGGVELDYLSHEGKPVRIVFAFTADGKILQTYCGPGNRRDPW
jgi:ketosteroid isomerase-like protein